MADYYFDIETVPKKLNDLDKKANLEPSTGKIATIQYQKLDTRTGAPIEPLTILKEWASCEREILEHFKPLITTTPWHFIPVGYKRFAIVRLPSGSSVRRQTKSSPTIEGSFQEKSVIQSKAISARYLARNALTATESWSSPSITPKFSQKC